MSMTDGFRSSEQFENQDSLRFTLDRRHGDASDSFELQKGRSFKKVGSDKSLYSGSSGKFFLCQLSLFVGQNFFLYHSLFRMFINLSVEIFTFF